MEVKAIHFEKGRPVSAEVFMTHDEALFIAVMVGRMNEPRAKEVIPDHRHEVYHEIYDCLVGELFNRHYECGTDGALRGDDE